LFRGTVDPSTKPEEHPMSLISLEIARARVDQLHREAERRRLGR
jgi:hypothetical protein